MPNETDVLTQLVDESQKIVDQHMTLKGMALTDAEREFSRAILTAVGALIASADERGA
jgi:hypothetical protein